MMILERNPFLHVCKVRCFQPKGVETKGWMSDINYGVQKVLHKFGKANSVVVMPRSRTNQSIFLLRRKKDGVVTSQKFRLIREKWFPSFR